LWYGVLLFFMFSYTCIRSGNTESDMASIGGIIIPPPPPPPVPAAAAVVAAAGADVAKVKEAGFCVRWS
jgi:hypothetical protein